MSETRTALVALVFAFLISVVFVFLSNRYSFKSFSPAIESKRFFFIGLILILFLIIDSLQFNLVDYFISKSNQADVEGLIDAFIVSRSVLYEPMIANIVVKPFTGIGFGIASDYLSMDIVRDPILGLPISAPIEKGVTPLMVLEEVGIIGFILFAIWIWILIRRSIVNGASAFLVMTTLLLLNLSEATLFSPGGAGLLILILLSSSATKPRVSKLYQPEAK